LQATKPSNTITVSLKMHFSTVSLTTFLLLGPTASAFALRTATTTSVTRTTSSLHAASLDTRPVYDPFGLYPESSEERVNGRLLVLEDPNIEVTNRLVLDPLNIYSPENDDDLMVDANIDMSASLPFLPRPQLSFDGTLTLAGDVGFDPFNLAGGTKEQLFMMRTAEVKHARLAMLAAVGWPVSEAVHTQLAHALRLTSLLGHGDKVPSLLNGGLDTTSPLFWMGVLAVAGTIEGLASIGAKQASFPGDLGFDPLGLYPEDVAGQERMQLAEIKNGRLAMMAITGFAVQELFTNMAVIHNLPFLN